MWSAVVVDNGNLRSHSQNIDGYIFILLLVWLHPDKREALHDLSFQRTTDSRLITNCVNVIFAVCPPAVTRNFGHNNWIIVITWYEYSLAIAYSQSEIKLRYAVRIRHRAYCQSSSAIHILISELWGFKNPPFPLTRHIVYSTTACSYRTSCDINELEALYNTPPAGLYHA